MQFPSFPTNHKAKIYAYRNITNASEVQFLQRCLLKHTKWIQVQAAAGTQGVENIATSKEQASCKDTVFHAEKLNSDTCLKWVIQNRRLIKDMQLQRN